MRITTVANAFAEPSDAELRALARLVWGAFPWLTPCSEGDFRAAFMAIGRHMRRLPAPDKSKYFYSHVADVNAAIEADGGRASDGSAVFASVIAWGLPVQLANPRLGILLEVGMSPHTGAPLKDEWKKVLAQASPLLAVVPPSRIAAGQDELGRALPVPRVYVEDRGEMRLVPQPGEGTW
jgi:hypothetical protein